MYSIEEEIRSRAESRWAPVMTYIKRQLGRSVHGTINPNMHNTELGVPEPGNARFPGWW